MTRMLTIEELNDVEAIRRHKAVYARLVDASADDLTNRSLARFADLFDEDATFTLGAKKLRGRQAICDHFFSGAPESRVQVWHSFHTPIVDIDGDSAATQWTMYARARMPADPDDVKVIVGRVHDTLRRGTDGRWRISTSIFASEPF